MNGWILFYKKIWGNPVFYGNAYAIAIWVWILTHADEEGNVTLGRNQVAKDTGIKPPTVQYWLKRFLSENYQLTIIETNNRFSRYHICNFKELQRKTISPSSPGLSANYQRTITNKEETIKKKNKIPNGIVELPAIQLVYQHYIAEFGKEPNKYKLTDKRKLKLKQRLKDSGEEMLRRAISNVANDPWYMGDNDRGWTADLDFIIRSEEQVEKLSNLNAAERQYDKPLKEVLNELQF